MLYAGRFAADLLAGQRLPPEATAQRRDPTGIVDWVRGPDDLALVIAVQTRLIRGAPTAPFPRRWIDVRSSFDPRDNLMDVDATRSGLSHSLRRCQLERLAAALVAVGAERLPADATAARSLVGDAWPAAGASYERTAHGFLVYMGTKSRIAEPHDPVLIIPDEIIVDLDR
jgi:hypothetical protein